MQKGRRIPSAALRELRGDRWLLGFDVATQHGPLNGAVAGRDRYGLSVGRRFAIAGLISGSAGALLVLSAHVAAPLTKAMPHAPPCLGYGTRFPKGQ